MIYPAKIEKNRYAEFRKYKNDMAFSVRVGKWIEHLSNKTEFKKFFMTFPKEDAIIYRTVGAKNESTQLKVQVDEDAWMKFRTMAGEHGMSGNYAINFLVDAYIKAKGKDLFIVQTSA